MIQINNISKSFGQQPVLKNVSLNVERGKTRVILGPSGSGKTVLLKNIIGLLQPDSGEIKVDGENIVGINPKRMLDIRKKFGMVFQQAALFDSMTVEQNIAFPLEEHGDYSAEEIASEPGKGIHDRRDTLDYSTLFAAGRVGSDFDPPQRFGSGLRHILSVFAQKTVRRNAFSHILSVLT